MVQGLFTTVFSDTHISSFKRHDDGAGSRLINSINGFEAVIEKSYAMGIRTFFFAGDITDTPKVLEITVIIELVKMGNRIKEKYPDIKIFAIDGNHDHHTKNMLSKRSAHSLQILEEIMPDILVIVSDTYHKVSDGIYVHGIPYYENDYDEALTLTYERAKALKEEEPDSKHYLLIHQTPKMLDMDFIPSDTDANDERYEIFDLKFCGHIHFTMWLSKTFLVVGNNIHRDSADKGKKKGYWLTNLVKPEKGCVFQYLEGFPEFVEVEAGENIEDQEGNFIIEKQDNSLNAPDRIIEEDKFSTAVEDTEIVKNYWEVVDGEDTELLTVGLSCIKSVKDEH